ncbi:MAG: FAD-dependent oxidoreductase [Chloroflexi bacterium]|nr:FAD-dependent oxidoreductase [Chloroflexota bacterium]
MYDVIIIGGGPAGLAAANYCLHKRLEVLLIAPELGGKANYRMHLAGLEGYEHITGEEIVRTFRSRLQYLDFARVRDLAAKIEPIAGENYETFRVLTQKGKHYTTKAIILATGADPIRLHLPEEEHLLGRGVSYSAISHAPLFWEREAAVVGSTDLALRSAAELATVASRVLLIAPEGLPTKSALRRKLEQMENVTILERHVITGIHGNGYVNSITIQDPAGRKQETPVSGVFGELGLRPCSDLVKNLVELDEEGYVKVDDRCRTSRPGIFAAGDVTDTFGEQVLIALGEGAKAALAAFDYLLECEECEM